MNFGDIPYFSSQYTLNSFVKNMFFFIFDKNIVHFVKKMKIIQLKYTSEHMLSS